MGRRRYGKYGERSGQGRSLSQGEQFGENRKQENDLIGLTVLDPAELGQESQASSCLRKGTPRASRVAQANQILKLERETQ